MPSRADKSLDRIFHALADTTRRKMLKALTTSDRSVGELARPHPISAPAISKHLKVLEGAGLVTRVRVGSTHSIQLREAPLERARRFLDAQRPLWSAELDALEQLVATKRPAERPPR